MWIMDGNVVVHSFSTIDRIYLRDRFNGGIRIKLEEEIIQNLQLQVSEKLIRKIQSHGSLSFTG